VTMYRMSRRGSRMERDESLVRVLRPFVDRGVAFEVQCDW